MPKGVPTILSASQEAKIRREYLKKPIKRLAKEMGIPPSAVYSRLRKLGLKVPTALAAKRKQIGMYRKGSEPFNKGKKASEYMSAQQLERSKKTQFKKGHVPHNAKWDGHERISKDGYVEVRVALGEYRHKHVVEWEKLHGKVKDRMVLVCLSEDRLNTNPSNWEMISREELMLRNSKHNIPREIIPSLVLTNKIQKKINQSHDA